MAKLLAVPHTSRHGEHSILLPRCVHCACLEAVCFAIWRFSKIFYKIIMGKQYNKVIKRARLKAYKERRKERIKTAKSAKGRK